MVCADFSVSHSACGRLSTAARVSTESLARDQRRLEIDRNTKTTLRFPPNPTVEEAGVEPNRLGWLWSRRRGQGEGLQGQGRPAMAAVKRVRRQGMHPHLKASSGCQAAGQVGGAPDGRIASLPRAFAIRIRLVCTPTHVSRHLEMPRVLPVWLAWTKSPRWAANVSRNTRSRVDICR